MGDTLVFLLLSVFLMLQNIVVFYTESVQLYAQHEGGILSSMLCQIMEQLRPKTGNPFVFLFRSSNHMLLIFHIFLVLVHTFCSNTILSISRNFV